MKEIVDRLAEHRTVERAKELLESEGYDVSRKNEAEDEISRRKRMLGLMKSNSTYKKMDSLCKKYGYELRSATGGNEPYIVIREPIEGYYPEIYYSGFSLSTEKRFFKIQTTSYGSLSAEEYEKFLKSCQDAYSLVTELNKLDMTTLYDPDSEE